MDKVAAEETSIASLNSLIEQKTGQMQEGDEKPFYNGDEAPADDDEADAHRATKDSSKARRENGLRRGKWTMEEEAYANRLIHEFKLGLLPLTDGTTLRTFLSKLLHCDPMRISKKFVGQNCIGKQVFRRRQADMDRLSPDDIKRSRYELAELERRFLSRVAQTNRTAKTAVGSATTPTPRAAAKLPWNSKGGEDSAPPDFARQQPVLAPWLLPPHAGSQAVPVRATPGAGAVAIAAPYGLTTTGRSAAYASQPHGTWPPAPSHPPPPPAGPYAPSARASDDGHERKPVIVHHGRPGVSSSSDDAHPERVVPTRLDRSRSDNFPTRPSTQSLTSFDLPSLNSMDNLAGLDLQSAWPSAAKLSQLGQVEPSTGLADTSRHASSSSLAAMAAAAAGEKGRGLSSWPSFSALVGGIDEEHNDPHKSQRSAPAPALNRQRPPEHHDIAPVSTDLAARVDAVSDEEQHPQQQRHRVSVKEEPSSSTASSGDAVAAPAPREVAPPPRTMVPDTPRPPPVRPAPAAAPVETKPLAKETDVGTPSPAPAAADAGPPRERNSAPADVRKRSGDAIHRSHRNSSVENFLSLVRSGDIPAPEADLLSHPILQQLGNAQERHKRDADDAFSNSNKQPDSRDSFNKAPRVQPS